MARCRSRGGNPDTGTKRGRPVPIISRRRGIWPTSRHRAIHHRRLEVTQINEQPVQLLKEIDESGIVRVVNAEIVPEPAPNEDVGQISKSKKSVKGEFLDQ